MDKATAVMQAALQCIIYEFYKELQWSVLEEGVPKPVGAEAIIECMKNGHCVRSNREIYSALNKLLKLGLIKTMPRGRKQSVYLPTVKGIIEWVKLRRFFGLGDPCSMEEEAAREENEENGNGRPASMEDVWETIEKMIPFVTENLNSIIEIIADKLPQPWLKDAHKKALELISAAIQRKENSDEEARFLLSVFNGPEDEKITGAEILYHDLNLVLIFAMVLGLQFRPQLFIALLDVLDVEEMPTALFEGWE
ncbi:MAG: hypothetical protein L7H00_06165 [Vulcanisaeta sp.]|nr:hypothetical protein [Vulcanisaeta sp.]